MSRYWNNENWFIALRNHLILVYFSLENELFVCKKYHRFSYYQNTAMFTSSSIKMSNAICRGLQSPVRRLAQLRTAQTISTSIVHNETILVKNNEEFINKVMNNDKPVIVNFHAEWCEPCKILTPKLKELIEPLNNLDLAVVDVEDNADLVHTFEVKAVPAVIAIKNGLIVDKFIGLVDADMITSLIDRMASKKKEEA